MYTLLLKLSSLPLFVSISPHIYIYIYMYI